MQSIMVEKCNIKLNSPLPVALQCPTVGSLLADINLAGGAVKSKTVWRWYPWLVLPATGYFLTLTTVVMFLLPEKLSQRAQLYLHCFGDMSVAIKLRFHVSAMFFTIGYATLLFHWIHYCGNWPSVSPIRRRITRQRIAPFKLLLGQCTPLQVGIRSRAQCAHYVHRAKAFVRWVPMASKQIALIVGCSAATQLSVRGLQDGFRTPLSLVTVPIHAVLYAFYVGYFFAIITYHMLYLSLLTTYLRLKLHQLSQDLEFRATYYPVKLLRASPNISREVHQLQWEVHSYNQHFWSRIIFAIISCFILNGAFTFYSLLFSAIPLVLRITTLSALVVAVITFCMLLIAVCRVHSLGGAIHRQLHAYHANNYASLRNTTDLGWFTYTAFRTKLKLQDELALFKPQTFGFTCGSIFSVNFSVFMEIVFIMAILFMKLFEFKSRL